jgi:CheY-like chemotaxis protein
MSADDIRNKWLFVAYSAKAGEDPTEDAQDYRERIDANKNKFAGSKGVGRFSCDRLGTQLQMQTRTRTRGVPVEVVDVDWGLFELDAHKKFELIPVNHTQKASFEIPADVPKIKAGTVLTIKGLREEWDREKLLKLRAAMAKLINPFGSMSDSFEVHLVVPAEQDADAKTRDRAKERPQEDLEQLIVNGQVRNFIFETLKGKTTHLETLVSETEEGSYIESRLTDRGALIYRIREPNVYGLLKGSGFACNLFYLNKSSKQTFTRRMGVNPVQFGSVFLFRHGFRIFPVGEEGTDTFQIDRRKQQGYKRFLGTRDIIGRIDIAGDDANFRESSSRDQGLVKTAAYDEMVSCFVDHCLKRLERYVVNVSWEIKNDLEVEDTSQLRGDNASALITTTVAKLAGATGVQLLEFNQDLIRILDERSDDFKASLASLLVLAEKAQNTKLLRSIAAAQKRYDELQRAQAAAEQAAEKEREVAEKERAARVEAERKSAEATAQADAAKIRATRAEAQAAQAQAQAQTAQVSYAEEQKRNLFLASVASVDVETIQNLHHQIVWEVHDPTRKLQELQLHKEIDLMLVDYKLGPDQIDGARLASQIRRSSPYTDMIFYSSEPRPELRRQVFENKIDGVYCCSRDDLPDETTNVVMAMTRRSLDVTHMRGIIVGAATDLDHYMERCLLAVASILVPGEFAALIESVVKEAEEYEAGSARDLRTLLGAGSIQKVLKSPAFGSNLKYRALSASLRQLELRPAVNYRLETFAKYQKQVIEPRNALAHARGTRAGGRVVLKGRDMDFDDDKMRDLRRHLIDHEDNLIALIGELQSQAAEAAGGRQAGEDSVLGAGEQAKKRQS